MIETLFAVDPYGSPSAQVLFFHYSINLPRGNSFSFTANTNRGLRYIKEYHDKVKQTAQQYKNMKQFMKTECR